MATYFNRSDVLPSINTVCKIYSEEIQIEILQSWVRASCQRTINTDKSNGSVTFGLFEYQVMVMMLMMRLLVILVVVMVTMRRRRVVRIIC